MSDVLNLNRFRKRKQRDDERQQAERNRVIHGRTKAEKRLARFERERAQQLLEGHRIDASDEESIDGLASDDGEDDSMPEPE